MRDRDIRGSGAIRGGVIRGGVIRGGVIREGALRTVVAARPAVVVAWPAVADAPCPRW
ncbi:hypothetical protein [Streptomyces sp. NPDC001100]